MKFKNITILFEGRQNNDINVTIQTNIFYFKLLNNLALQFS